MPLVLRVALRQLWDRKLLNGIAVFGVALGVLTLVAITAILNGFQEKFLLNIIQVSPHVTVFDTRLRSAPPLLARFRDDFVTAKVAREVPSDRQVRLERPHEIARLLTQLPGVEAASGVLVGSGVVTFGPKQYPVSIRGIDVRIQDRVTPISKYLIAGSYGALKPGAGGALIGVGLAKRIGAKFGDSVTLGFPAGRTLRLKVVGVFDAGIPFVDGSRVYLTLQDAQAVLGRPDSVDRLEVRLTDAESASSAARQAEAMLGYDSESWQEANANFLSLFRQQNTIIAFVIAAILAVGGFGIFAIQLMIALQKTRDIAMLRSIGFRRPDILNIFLLQGAIVAFTGALLGDGFGHLLVGLLGNLKTRQEGLIRSETFLVADNLSMYIYGTLFAVVVGVIASSIPAYRASRVEPVDVLRGQIA